LIDYESNINQNLVVKSSNTSRRFHYIVLAWENASLYSTLLFILF